MTTPNSTKVSAPSGMDAVYYLTQDLARSRTFYEDVLGLQFVRDYQGSFIEADLADGTTFGIGFIPDGFHVSGGVMFASPDLEEASARVRASGAKVNGEYDGGNCTMLWFEDPDGNTLCLHRRKPGAV